MESITKWNCANRCSAPTKQLDEVMRCRAFKVANDPPYGPDAAWPC